MLKTYHCISGFFAFNETINGKTRRIEFESLTNGSGSIFTTSDTLIQQAIERRSDFGTYIIVSFEETDKSEKDADNANDDKNKGEIKDNPVEDESITLEEITNIQELREYLIKECKVHHASLNSPDNILKKAKEFKILTPNLAC